MRKLAEMARKLIWVSCWLYLTTELTGGLDIMTCQLVVYVDNVYLLGENKNTVNKITEALLDARVNIG
jgi:hypothetical protein